MVPAITVRSAMIAAAHGIATTSRPVGTTTERAAAAPRQPGGRASAPSAVGMIEAGRTGPAKTAMVQVGSAVAGPNVHDPTARRPDPAAGTTAARTIGGRGARAA